MNNVIQLNKNNYISDNRIIKLFEDIDKSIKKVTIKYKDEVNIYFFQLCDYFYNVYNKVKNNRWINKTGTDKFLSYYNLILADETNELDIIFLQLEYIKLFDTVKFELFNLNNNEVKSLINHFFELEEDNIDISLYKKIVKYLQLPQINDIIYDSESNSEKKGRFVDVILLIKSGYNYLEIINMFNEISDDFEDLTTGIITIDKIHKYYINESTLFVNNENQDSDTLHSKINCSLTNNQFNNIDKIVLLNGYSDSLKNKFIFVVQKIESMKVNLYSKLVLISDLVELFIYFKDKLDKLDIENILILLTYKNINEYDWERSFDDLERSKLK